MSASAPLTLGFHSLHTILGVHCLPLYNLLHYIDNGVLLLTETSVMRLMKGKQFYVVSLSLAALGLTSGYVTHRPSYPQNGPVLSLTLCSTY